MIHLGVPAVIDLAYLAEHMRQDEREQWCALIGREEYDADTATRIFASTQGYGWCLFDDDMPLIAGGLECVRSQVWQTWMVGTQEAWERHWLTITKICRRQFDSLFEDGTARRIQTSALESRTLAHKWYERGLQQTFEGVHRSYFADGQNAVTYARTRADWEASRG